MESDTPIDNLEGRALGPYRDLVLIGKGAMSYVYRGRQPALHRWVAIKVLPPRFLHTADFIRRFQREAEIVASFQHAHILPIFDADCDSDIPYLVMPYAPGGTLRQRMREPLPLHRAITLLQQVCDALEYAHTRQPTVVHRDVKPSNILLLREDFALLGDFGLAKVLQTPAVSAQSRTGVVGTPEYMAPEQALRGEVDGRTDVYAVGIILYEILTGRPPFTGKLPVEVMLQHIREPLSPVRTLNPAIPEAWEEVVQRALAKDPADRYPSAAVLRAALEEAHRGRPEAMIATPGTQGAEREPPLSHLFHEAESAFTVEDWERTISLCGQILRLAPDSPVALQLLRRAQERRNEARQRELAECLERAEAATIAEDWAAARVAYEAALRLAPSEVAAAMGLRHAQWGEWLAAVYGAAQADIQAGRWAEAVANLDRLLEHQNADYLERFAAYRQAAELRRQAQEHLDTERWLAGWYDYGTAALRQGDSAAAAEAFQHVLGQRADYRDAGRQLAAALAALERQRAAQDVRSQPGASLPPAQPAEEAAAAAGSGPASVDSAELSRPAASPPGTATEGDDPGAHDALRTRASRASEDDTTRGAERGDTESGAGRASPASEASGTGATDSRTAGGEPETEDTAAQRRPPGTELASPAAASVPRVIIGRRAILSALYAQGLGALHRRDYAAAVDALAPVVEEASDAYPDAHALLAEAERGAGERAAAGEAPGAAPPEGAGRATLPPEPAEGSQYRALRRAHWGGGTPPPAAGGGPEIGASPVDDVQAPSTPPAITLAEGRGDWRWWAVAGLLAALITAGVILMYSAAPKTSAGAGGQSPAGGTLGDQPLAARSHADCRLVGCVVTAQTSPAPGHSA